MNTVVAEGSMQEERLEQIQAILELSRQMLELASAREWEVLAAVEPTRRQLLHKFFGVAATPQDTAPIAAFIQQVLAVDRQIVAWGDAYRLALMDRLNGIGRARLACHAYGENTG
jgi:hypothetical protein